MISPTTDISFVKVFFVSKGFNATVYFDLLKALASQNHLKLCFFPFGTNISQFTKIAFVKNGHPPIAEFWEITKHPISLTPPPHLMFLNKKNTQSQKKCTLLVQKIRFSNIITKMLYKNWSSFRLHFRCWNHFRSNLWWGLTLWYYQWFWIL